jgi:copper(I)-binding protein
VLATLAGCDGADSRSPELEIKSAWVRPAAVAGDGGAQVTSAVYFEIHNRGNRDDRLNGAGFEGARRVEIHETHVQRDGLATMRPVEFVVVAAGGTVRLEPGGVHVMLMDLERSLVAGDTVSLWLDFELAGRKTVLARVTR